MFSIRCRMRPGRNGRIAGITHGSKPQHSPYTVADSPLFRFARDPRGEELREEFEFGGASRIWASSALPELREAGLHVLVGVSKQDLLDYGAS